MQFVWKGLAGELSLISLSFVDMLKNFGFLHSLELLVSKATSTTSLLQFCTFIAVDVSRGEQLRRKTVFFMHLWSQFLLW